MKILRCDRCGHEASDSGGIVGREFEYLGFKTLSPKYRFEKVVDVCDKCFNEIQKVVLEVKESRQQAERALFIDRVARRSVQ